MDPKFHSKVSQKYEVQKVFLSPATNILSVVWLLEKRLQLSIMLLN